LTKREALARYKLSTHKPNINAYVVYASTASAREAAAQLNAYNFSISWNSKKGAGARGSLAQMEAWRVLRCDVASGAPFVAHLSIFIGGLPYKVRHVEYLLLSSWLGVSGVQGGYGGCSRVGEGETRCTVRCHAVMRARAHVHARTRTGADMHIRT
jgi:hypothetical protein